MIFKMATASDFSSFFPQIFAWSLNDFKLLILRAEIRGKKEEKMDAVAVLKIISSIGYLYLLGKFETVEE